MGVLKLCGLGVGFDFGFSLGPLLSSVLIVSWLESETVSSEDEDSESDEEDDDDDISTVWVGTIILIGMV
jgi:hypothetical protein